MLKKIWKYFKICNLVHEIRWNGTENKELNRVMLLAI